ncbi:MAG: hypothetical protein K6G81_12495 [Lachnospiraceae bacterium]|nr:hypothetical protein [Lachnospiraceae bacterium]
MEFVAPVRPVPLFIKQPIVRFFSKASNKKVSMVLSNMGVQKPPQEMVQYIDSYTGFCSSNNLFSTIFSFNGELSLGVSSPYKSTGAVKNLVRRFSDMGIDIRVYATEVIR